MTTKRLRFASDIGISNPIKKTARYVSTFLMVFLVGLIPPNFPSVEAQGACVACDEIQEKSRIARDMHKALSEGLEMLEKAGEKLRSNENVADAFAAAHFVLGGTNIVLGAATLPCDIPKDWLRGVLGGASGLGTFLQGSEWYDIPLTSLVSASGFGVVTDYVSFINFSEEYWKGNEDIDRLENDLKTTIDRMKAAQERLEIERDSLRSWIEEGNCEDDRLEDLLDF